MPGTAIPSSARKFGVFSQTVGRMRPTETLALLASAPYMFPRMQLWLRIFDLSVPSNPQDSTEKLDAVIALAAKCAARGWTPATAGNFSLRLDSQTIAITRSGTDKGALEHDDILSLPLAEPPPREASAEAPIHWALYRTDSTINAIAHCHSPAATMATLLPGSTDGTLRLAGWELLKAITGQTTHETELYVPVLPNTQDMAGLADKLAPPPGVPALLLQKHGIYAWGRDPEEAFRHMEAFETLFDLELNRRQLGL